MTSTGDIRQFVEKYISERASQLGVDMPSFSDDLSITGSGLMDSMDFFGLITEVEDTFEVEADFTSEDPSVFTTLAGFVACVERSKNHNG
jgi:acyl carrier protein